MRQSPFNAALRKTSPNACAANRQGARPSHLRFQGIDAYRGSESGKQYRSDGGLPELGRKSSLQGLAKDISGTYEGLTLQQEMPVKRP
jgi:hypothetical protein